MQTKFDFEIKKDIFNNALLLNKNMSLIGYGAHIGDGLIPLAHPLKHSGKRILQCMLLNRVKINVNLLN